MKVYTIHEAKTQLSKLIRQALTGNEVVIANRTQPLVRLQPFRLANRTSLLGDLKGKIRLSASFNAPMDDFKDYE